jgi:hypothetical protein
MSCSSTQQGVLCLAFEKDHKHLEAVRDYTQKRLEMWGLTVVIDGKDSHLLLVSANSQLLEIEAEHSELQMYTKEGLLRDFEIAASADFKNYGTPDFFMPCERLSLLQGIVEHVVTDGGFDQFKSDAQLVAGADIVTALKFMGMLEAVFPLHANQARREAFSAVMWSAPFRAATIGQLYAYYGAEVALYFAWMDHFTLWLLPPAVFGTGIWAWNTFDPLGNGDATIDNNVMVSLFSIFIIVWGILFVQVRCSRSSTARPSVCAPTATAPCLSLHGADAPLSRPSLPPSQFWKQKCAAHACRWGTLGEEARTVVRPEFAGELRKSPVGARAEREQRTW